MSIPRLELCAAVLLAKLINYVQNACHLKDTRLVLWSDSAVVLGWVRKQETSLRMYVRNRVHQVRENVGNSEWNYVPSAENPADLISRGLSPVSLIKADMWWGGPAWLTMPIEKWPTEPKSMSRTESRDLIKECKSMNGPVDNEEEEGGSLRTQQRLMIQMATTGNDWQELLDSTSRLTRLQRVTAWIFRFITKALPSRLAEQRPHLAQLSHPSGALSAAELSRTLTFWIKQVQGVHFSKELTALKSNQPIKMKSGLQSLTPFIDDEGMLRVGGRLRQADISYEERHPILLPELSTLSKLIMRYIHIKAHHGGPSQMNALIRQSYWITGGRRLARLVIRHCPTCSRYEAVPLEQRMADLPAVRVTPARPFLFSGVDFAGPFNVKARGGRCKIIEKRYIAVFVCMSSKAVHLELAEDLSTKAFVDAFIRFTSIRGRCQCLYSDNGTNFIGAEKYLREMIDSWQGTDFVDRLAMMGTDWVFITPSAPHQGGLWEAAVRRMKFHLRRVIGQQLLTAEAYHTIIAQVGAILNSRPLCTMPDGLDDYETLTPAHLLIGEPIVQPMGKRWTETPMNRLQQFEVRQKTVQHFWDRWRDEYLMQLQRRQKWQEESPNLQVGDIVLIRHENTSPSSWPFARAIEVHPGGDGLVRSATVRTAQSVLRRPIRKLVRVPTQDVEA